jgi:hypothetical protein
LAITGKAIIIAAKKATFTFTVDNVLDRYYVDALTQALRYLKDAGIIRIDPADIPDEYADDVRPRFNPYAQ